jgi:hypothetical protein
MITEEKLTILRKIRRWAVVQRFTLLRGYGWGQVPMLGVIFASTIKAAFPMLIDSFQKYIILIIVSFIALYLAGYIDYKLKLLHEEQKYATETNPMLMAGLRGELKNGTTKDKLA